MDIRRMDDSSTAKNINGGKKNQFACPWKEDRRCSAAPNLIVSFHGSPVLFCVLQGLPRGFERVRG